VTKELLSNALSSLCSDCTSDSWWVASACRVPHHALCSLYESLAGETSRQVSWLGCLP